MRSFVLVFVSAACAGNTRRVQQAADGMQGDSYEEAQRALARLFLESQAAAAFTSSGLGMQSHGMVDNLASFHPAVLSRGPRNIIDVRMDDKAVEPSDKAITLGAAAIGGLLGVQFTGDATKSAGKVAAKVYGKTVDINEEYDVLPKVKGATDTVFKVADNINKNYGITDQIDSKLTLSVKIAEVKDKVADVTDSITTKVDDLKSKATES